MYELHSGHRLMCEKVIRSHLRARMPLVGSSSLASIGNEIRGGCQFILIFLRSLGHLLGGLVGLPLVNPLPILPGSSIWVEAVWP